MRVGKLFNATGVGTNAGVTVTVAADGNKTHELYSFDYSGDAAALVTVESPSGTVLWRKRYAAAFNDGVALHKPIRGATGAALLLKISASTANCEMNGQGASH